MAAPEVGDPVLLDPLQDRIVVVRRDQFGDLAGPGGVGLPEQPEAEEDGDGRELKVRPSFDEVFDSCLLY
ncbi:MAG: hypothetical protein ACSLFD_04280, partial [Solirubrobacterales bacterium]